jgi:hypothetical protein
MTKQTLFSEADLLDLYKQFERSEVGYDRHKPKHYPCVVVLDRQDRPGYREFHYDFQYVYLDDFE